ncbi:MAG TPA: Smr/MutS family protein [Blastocatellia bacterium]|nr:Smr/MutS family protein [Blastocatellia bacterium]
MNHPHVNQQVANTTPANNRAIGEQALATLEFGSLVDLLAGYTQTALGAGKVRRLSPVTDLQEIRTQQQRVTECVAYIKKAPISLGGLPDPTESLTTLAIQDTNLDAIQILDLVKLIRAGLDLRGQFADVKGEYPALNEVIRQIPDLRTLLSQIEGKILPTGEMDDNASAELKRIRREINQLRSDIHRSLESLMRRDTNAIQEEIITVRNGRFVIPVRNDSRGKVPGVMHGVSSSGQTAFIEPLATIDSNNDLVRLHELEEAEITKILFTLTNHLRGELERLHRLIDALSEVDFIAAKARLSRDYNCIAPTVHEDNELVIEEGRHILLERNLRGQNKQVVPISLKMDQKSKSVMIISGPNAGGKTVVLKTVGLMSLMAQSGLHVPAKSANLPVFGQILADIGDHQSIAANLSTFSAHMQNIRQIADVIEAPAMVLLDEVGTGTDPDEGAALGTAIVDYFKRKGALVLASTHYNRLKMYAYNTPEVLNASVEFDAQTLQPTYRLLTDLAGASSGIEIARRLGLSTAIVDEAARLMSTKEADANEYLLRLKAHVDEQQSVTAALEDERRAVADKYAKLELDFVKRERERSAEFENELKRITDEFTRESQMLVNQIQDRAQKLKLEKEQQKRLADLKRHAGEQIWRQKTESQQAVSEKLKPILNKSGASKAASSASQITSDVAQSSVIIETPAAEKPLNIELKVGGQVKVAGFDQPGTIESIRGDQVDVRVGFMKMKVDRNKLSAIEPAKPAPKKVPAGLPRGVNVSLQENEDVPRELNVIGYNVDDATSMTDKFLDDAFLGNLDSVRIVHGSGMGILRKALSKFLTGHPHVERFHPAPQNEGGGGATIVELRK